MSMKKSKIKNIKKIKGFNKTIDIHLDGNNLFFANSILTHNSGVSNTDPDMTNVAESLGLPMTVDLLLAIISNPQLDELNQKMIKQLKNRYNDTVLYNKFIVGLNKSKMKFYDVNAKGQIQSTNQTNIQNTQITNQDLGYEEDDNPKLNTKSFKDWS